MRAGVLTALLAAAAAAVLGQIWADGERAGGVVLDLDLQPVEGAVVTLESEEWGGGPPPARTDAAGRWALTGLAPGRWQIRIQAEGFIDAAGFLMVGGAGQPLEVRLRSLAEVSPRGFEGDPMTVLRWLEKGNSLLAQGESGAARAEFGRALLRLPPGERPQVLRAIARTHWLEGDAEATLAALEEAAAADPEDRETLQLLAAVLEAVGRAGELDQILARARQTEPGGPVPVRGPMEPTDAPLRAPGPGLSGLYQTRFESAGPSSGIETYRARFGLSLRQIEEVDADGGRYDPQAESFVVYVPEGEAPPGGWGLLVWVSATPFGGFHHTVAEARDLADERRFIWVGANRSGNRRLSWYRVALALDAVHHLRRFYPIDERRVWAAGYSGGGRVASSLAMLYPEVFRGGLFLFGCNFYRQIAVTDRPGHHWPARFPQPDRETFWRLKQLSRFVLLTGELDFNRSETRRIYEEMVGDGFEHILYLEIPEASHYSRVGREWLGRALSALERGEQPH